MAERWTNWAGQQTCTPAVLASPASEDEVRREVAAASAAGHEVRVAGAGHSFGPICLTDGRLLRLHRLDRILDADRASGLVRVQAGIGLAALGEALAGHGLALENQGDIDAQALAGALQTATHGTGERFANLSSRVEAMRLVVDGGDVVEVTGGDQLRAARVALGALGVITEVTLRCVPAFTLDRVDEPVALDEVLADLDARVAAHDHFELFVFPWAREAIVRRSRRCHDEPVARPRLAEWVQEDVLENRVLAFAGAVSRRAPRAVPTLNRAMMRGFSENRKVDRSYRVYASKRAVRFTEMELAIPREHAVEGVRRTLAALESSPVPVAMPVEVRFTAGDDALLSTAHERDTCYLAAHQHVGADFATPLRAVAAALEPFAPRPHWGKRHELGVDALRARYPRWDDFQAVRDRLDPRRRFTNDHLRRVLGP